jgi:hypothetical protein
MGIGSLNESPLHQALKDLYSVADAEQEVALGAYVADVVHPDAVVYEIQTAGFGRMRRKLPALLDTHRVVLVHPVTAVRWIHKLTDEGLHADDSAPPARPRRSPKRGRIADVLAELVSIPLILDHPNFELEVVLVELDEFWRPGRRRRGDGWVVVQRRLREVVGRERFRSSADLFRLLQSPLVEPFSTAELAEAMAAPRHLGQKLAFCLRACGRIEPCGKTGNAILYRRAWPVHE